MMLIEEIEIFFLQNEGKKYVKHATKQILDYFFFRNLYLEEIG